MKENLEPFKFIDLLICPNCFASNLKQKEKTIECQKCNNKFIFDKNQTVIFEEVYEVSSARKTNKFVKLPKHKFQKGWRDLNTLEVYNWSKSLKKSDYILDLGCGPLTHFNFLKNSKTIYIDGARFDNINIVCNFEKKICIKDNSIDKILLSNVLEHIYNPSFLFSEMNRVLKTNGECFILVPFTIKHHQQPFDFNRYTKYYLERLSKESNFKLIRIKEIGSLSNIIGTALRTQKRYKKATKKFIFKDRVINFLRKIIYSLYILDRRLSGHEEASKEWPQGFLVELKKI